MVTSVTKARDLFSQLSLHRVPVQLTIFILFNSFVHSIWVDEVVGEIHNFRQGQTALLTSQFMLHGVDFRSPLPVFGESKFVPFEFPLFQAIASQLGNFLGLPADTSTRMVSFIFFILTGILMASLLNRWCSNISSAIFLFLFSLTPFAFQWGHTALIDWSPVALSLSAVILLDRSVAGGLAVLKISLASLLFAGAMLIKPTTAVIFLPLLWTPNLVLFLKSKIWKSLTPPFLVSSFGLLVTYLYTNFADTIKQQQKYTVNLTSDALQEWNFGTLTQRLDPTTWDFIFSSHWESIFGHAIIWVAAIFIVFILLGTDVKYLALIISVILGPVIFFNLYWVHDYYAIAIYSQVQAIIALALAALWEKSRRSLGSAALISIAGLGIIGVAWLSEGGRSYLINLSAPWRYPLVADWIRLETAEDSKILWLGADWNSLYPLVANRESLMLADWTTLPIQGAEFKEYDYVVIPNGQVDLLQTLLPDPWKSGYVLVPESDQVWRVEQTRN